VIAGFKVGQGIDVICVACAGKGLAAERHTI